MMEDNKLESVCLARCDPSVHVQFDLAAVASSVSLFQIRKCHYTTACDWWHKIWFLSISCMKQDPLQSVLSESVPFKLLSQPSLHIWMSSLYSTVTNEDRINYWHCVKKIKASHKGVSRKSKQDRPHETISLKIHNQIGHNKKKKQIILHCKYDNDNPHFLPNGLFYTTGYYKKRIHPVLTKSDD